jgi:hypothetical protein
MGMNMWTVNPTDVADVVAAKNFYDDVKRGGEGGGWWIKGKEK